MLDWFTSQTPSAVLIDLGITKIHWYGLLVASAIVIGLAITHYLYNRYRLKRDLFWDLSFYTIIFAFIGDRLAHVFFYEWEYYSANLFDIFKIWQGGLAIHGAIFVGLLAIYIYARKYKLSFWVLGDIFAPAIAIGLAIGRWGNYFNQEIYGLPSNSWIAIPIDLTRRVSGFESSTHFLPSFLFTSFANLIIFGILILLHHLKLKKEYRILDGSILISFLFLYAISRFCLEFLRIDSQPVFLTLRTGQWMSVVTIGLVIAMLIYRRAKNTK